MIIKDFHVELSKYQQFNVFSYKASESLSQRCNAPRDRGGVYLIYKVVAGDETLIYIGSSGQLKKGVYKVRKSGLGGMKDRLVNGHHPKFGKIARSKTFPAQMNLEKIDEIKVYWWVTHDDVHKDLPTEVEDKMYKKYLDMNSCAPSWHR